MKQKNKSIIQSIRESLLGPPDQAVNNAPHYWSTNGQIWGVWGPEQMGHCTIGTEVDITCMLPRDVP